MTTTEASVLDLHEDERILNFGRSDVNASFPIGAKKLQILYPSSGAVSDASPLAENANVELRQLLEKNTAMSLHKSYVRVGFTVRNSDGSGLSLEQRRFFYTSWNPYRLFSNGTLWVGSTNVEHVNDIPAITDVKLALCNPYALKTTMSDVVINPIDSMLNGFPCMRSNVTVGGGARGCDGVLDDTITVPYSAYNISPIDTAVAPQSQATNATTATNSVPVEPNPAWVRNALYINPAIVVTTVATEEPNSEGWLNWMQAPTGAGNAPMNYFGLTTILVGENVAPYQVPATGPVKRASEAITLYKRLPLSGFFGFCEKNVLIPSNLIQINLVRGTKQNFLSTLNAAQAPITNVNVDVTATKMVLVYYDLQQSSADLLTRDQTLTVNHYSRFNTPFAGTGAASFSLQVYSGLKAVFLRFPHSGCPPSMSPCPFYNVSFSIIYRGKQYPLQLEPVRFSLRDDNAAETPKLPVTLRQHLNGAGNLINLDSSTYYEEYSSFNSCNYDGMSASLMPAGVTFNESDWVKSNCTVCFSFTQDQSDNVDSVAGPLQIAISGNGKTYDADTFSVNAIIQRVNMLKYLGQSRQFVFITNGSS